MNESVPGPASRGEPPCADSEGPPPGRRPTWAEVDLEALVANYGALAALLESPSPRSDSVKGRPRLIPVLKADAYGHGAVPVGRALARAGAGCLAVALVEEAVALREAGLEVDILVLEGAWPGQERAAVRHGLILAVHSPESIDGIDRAASMEDRTARVHVKVDTGMGRLGFPWDRLQPGLDGLRRAGRLRLSGVFSHLAAADRDAEYTAEQVRRFEAAAAQVESAARAPLERHLANSAGLLQRPETRRWSARAGIALYGYPPVSASCPVALRPAFTLKSRIVRVETIPAGASVGYNRRFVAPRETRTATIPIGYADGYRRDLGGRAGVIVRGRRAPVLGTVSMDMIVIDLTDHPEVAPGEEVILLGSSEACAADAAAWADLLGTIPYEVLCGIGHRVPRVYRGRD